MGIVSTTKGGGKFYVSPHIEVILVQAEKGFAVTGDNSNPGGPVSPMSYDEIYSDEY
ncbi:hypothetical protein [uncultured Alistipes sp.]|jgi:hypothetical protein|uniref:hypothetical protein n=1 Tax=Alistipes sp. TaxID=1872444 RepID=UPI0025D10C99|nr:hypothetical protein [uncultured Alistipes sp.]